MPGSGTMPPSDLQEPADILLQLALPRSQKVVLVIDLVESVRLMSADEAGTVARWHGFVQRARDHTIPQHRGRLVKSLGDGLMVEFEQARDAINAAQTLHSAIAQTNAGLAADRHMHLRAGINSSQIYTDQLDIYGTGVNLAARLATLAGPGETVVSASVRDGLTDGLDVNVEDLGECYLKHIDEPVRAYRAGGVGALPVVIARIDYDIPLQPKIAVIPFEMCGASLEHFVIGEVIADAVIAQLSRSANLKLVSRLSTTAFRSRETSLEDVKRYLGADYALSGTYIVRSRRITISAELADTQSNSIIWAERMDGDVEDLFSINAELPHRIAQAAHSALLRTQVQLASVAPLPTLNSYSIFLGGIQLMHRSNPMEFDRSRTAFDYLVDRHRNSAVVRAWRAKWSILRMTRGLTTDAHREAAEALDHTQRALDIEPSNALALAVEGFVYCHLKRDLEIAYQRVQMALALDPSCALAWLFMATIQSLRGNSKEAVECGERAIALSPLDPLKYYYQCLTGSAMLFDGKTARARELLSASWVLNRSHAPTIRLLVVANSELGDMVNAKEFMAHLRRIEPELTVERYMARSPGAVEVRSRFAQAMASAGLPSR